jgi:hypothetical protein
MPVPGNLGAFDRPPLLLDLIRRDSGILKHFDKHKQLVADVGGFGKKQGIALSGEPGSGNLEFVPGSRHVTLRCNRKSAEHLASIRSAWA